MTKTRMSPHAIRTPRVVLALASLALFLDILLYDVVVPFLPGYVRQWGVSEAAIGLVFASYSLTVLVFTPIMGRLTDRVGRRRPILFGIAGLALASIVYACATNIVMLLVGRLLQGAAGASLSSASLALLADVFPVEKRGQVMGTAMSVMSLGALLGPPLGGLLYVYGDYQLPFTLAAVFSGGVGIILYWCLPEPVKQERRILEFGGEFRNVRALTISGVVLIGATFLSMLEPLLPLHLEDRLELRPDAIGMLFGIATLSYGISSLLAGHLSPSRRRWAMAGGLAASGTVLPLIACPTNIWLEAGTLIPLGVACAFLLAPTLPALADVADERGTRNYGATYAFFNVAYAGGMLVGPLLGGILTDAYGFAMALIVVGVAALVYAPIAAVMLGRHSKQQAQRRSLAA